MNALGVESTVMMRAAVRHVLGRLESSKSFCRTPTGVVFAGRRLSRHRVISTSVIQSMMGPSDDPVRSWRSMRGQRTIASGAAGEYYKERERRDDRQLRVSHILVHHEDAALLQEIVGKLAEEGNGGGDGPGRVPEKRMELFSSLAKEYSSCPSSRGGGDLGWVRVGQMVGEFEDACFRSSVGDLVQCETEYGRHLIYVTDEQRVSVVIPMSVEEVATILMDEGEKEKYQLLDVREQWEADKASLPGFAVMPLSDFESWGPRVKETLRPDAPTVGGYSSSSLVFSF